MNKPRLQILICTLGQRGLEKVSGMTLPQVDGVEYMVSLQNPDNQTINTPQTLIRDDLRIIQNPTRGLSRNRNASLAAATGDILLIADDDLHYTAEGLTAVIDTFADDPTLDMATFAHRGGDDKQFPTTTFDLAGRHPKGYYITSFEIALRRDSLPADIRFNENMGIGAPYFGTAEENLFVHQLIERGLHGRFIPKTIVCHPDISSGERQATPNTLHAQGAWLRIRYGSFSGLLRLLRDIPRRNAPWHKAFRHMIAGYLRAPELLKKH